MRSVAFVGEGRVYLRKGQFNRRASL